MTTPISDADLARLDDYVKESYQIGYFIPLCMTLGRYEELRERLRLAEAVVQAATYFIDNNRSWRGADNIMDAIGAYRAALGGKQ